ncbi:MAG: hypothetical protein ACOYL7_12165, partial [Caldilinea sp.]
PVRPRRPGLLHRLGWLFARLVAAFLFLSVALVVIFRFVPVPVTMTMIMDPNGITKTWVPLSEIDRNLSSPWDAEQLCSAAFKALFWTTLLSLAALAISRPG